MSSPQIERKLAAIMFTDIAGYTEQMSKDEAVAISLLETKKKVFKLLLKKYNGKLVKELDKVKYKATVDIVPKISQGLLILISEICLY